MKKGKKYQEAAKLVEKGKLYDPQEALSVVCKTATAKFDETIELHVKLGVDSRHADQQVRGAVVLPNGTGKKVRVLVFARDDKAEAAKAAGWTDIKCIEIAGVQGDQTNTARMNGYKAGVEEAGGTFLSDEVQYADATADRATTAMEAIMQTHPEGIAIICANNDDMAMAAARAAQGHDA